MSVTEGRDAFGYFDNGKLVAYWTTGPEIIGSQSKYILLDQLFVSKDYRSRNIGRKILRLCAESTKERGAEKLYLCAGSSEDTIAFYQKTGCVPAEEINTALFREARNDIRMELFIR